MFQLVVDFILPERCPSCGIITPAGGGFCGECWAGLHYIAPPWCAACALPLPFEPYASDPLPPEEGQGQYCATCLTVKPVHDGIRAVVAYGEISAKIALNLKYGGKVGLAKMIAAQLRRHIPENPCDIIVAPVPLHWTRLWRRSFNQSALIGRHLAHDNDMDFLPDLLIRTKSTPPLRGLSPVDRRRTVAGVFAINPKWRHRMKGARVILVDDVYTSGATTNACIKILKKEGARHVQIYCWARVLPGEILPENMI